MPKAGHLSQKTPEYAAAEPPFRAESSGFGAYPTIATFREAAGDPDAIMLPEGPDRYREVTSESMQFTVRDGETIELKLYKSPNIIHGATLLCRMHGGERALEHPFATPSNDCYDGLLWCKDHAKVLGVDPGKIILVGGSTGANLAAALALEARDDGITGILAQPKPDQRHSPLLAVSLSGLPSTLTQYAGVDVLRDGGMAYAEALQTAGVEVKRHVYQGVPHCFHSTLILAPETVTFHQRLTTFLQRCAGWVQHT
ncbi:Alpha/Beta hydrolase protein [Xylariaceae sp. FL0804]|nr:Alpha/Beta hydrolase protein [Xylariaceae sp. FL0804]